MCQSLTHSTHYSGVAHSDHELSIYCMNEFVYYWKYVFKNIGHSLVPKGVLSIKRNKVRLFLQQINNLVGITKEQNSIWTKGNFQRRENMGTV